MVSSHLQVHKQALERDAVVVLVRLALTVQAALAGC